MYQLLILLQLAFTTIINAQLFGNFGKIPNVKSVSDVASKFGQAFEASFDSFQSQYNKVYDTPEIAQLRKAIFKNNFEEIQKFNEEFAKGLKTFELGVNEFIDLASEEFNKLFNGFGKTRSGQKKAQPDATIVQPSTTNIPDHVDWREKGAVGPVKYQGQCASCYAFSAAGAVEGQLFKKTGKLYDLSPQDILDCSSKPPYENDGCNGGYTDISIDYIKKTNGLDVENAYPYEAEAKQCRSNANTTQSINVANCGRIRAGDEKALEAAVANIGPISAAIDASHSTFQNYKSGIYDEPKCGNRIGDLNHAILVVGYGVDEKTGEKYWLCKNTYGTGWGENGYFRIVKDKNNHCGIASWAVYPIV